MNRGFLYVLIIFFTGLTFWKGVIPAFQTVTTDFSNYYVAARLVIDGENLDSLYRNSWFREASLSYGVDNPGKFSPFPPITAFLLIPLTGLDPLGAQQVFTILNLFLFGACIVLTRQITQWSWEQSSLFLLVSGLGLINNLRLGQVYIIILLCTLLAYRQGREGKGLLPGFLIALSASLKYFTVIYLPAFWSVGHRRLVYQSILVLCLLFGFQWIFFGPGILVEYFTHALLPHLSGNPEGQEIYHFGFQSWESFLSFLFVADPEYNPHPWLDLPAAKTWIKYSILLFVLAGLAVGIKKIMSFPEPLKLNGYLGLTGISAFALLPASATYHFVMLSFPVLLLVLIPGLDRTRKWIMLLLYASIGLIPYNFFEYLGNNWGVFFGFPRLWATTLLFVTALTSIMNLEHNPARFGQGMKSGSVGAR